MSPASHCIIIDFGIAWSKAFLLAPASDAPEQFIIQKKIVVPTSTPELEISYKALIGAFPEVKNVPVVLTSSFCKKEAVESFTSAPFVHTEEVYQTLTEFFARSNLDILILDGGAGNWLQNFSSNQINTFSFGQITDIEIENYIGNKRHSLYTIAQNEHSVDIEQAFLKQYLSSKTQVSGAKNTLVVVGGGMLSYSQNRNLVLEILVDRLNLPFCQILLDTDNFIPSFGAFLSHFSDKKTLLQVPSLINLVSLVNLGSPGSLEIDFGFQESQKLNVGLDEIVVLPTQVGHEVTIKQINKEKLHTKMTTGQLGLIVDARVKPLDLAPKSITTKEKLKGWREALQSGKVL